MSCIVTVTIGTGKAERVIRRGTEPRHPATWKVAAWFVLATGEKITHSATIQGATVAGLVPAVGQLIDSLIADHGNQVTGAGWVASTHGKRKK